MDELKPHGALPNIGGPPRSGTTLLANIFNEQPKVGIFSELYFGEFLQALDPLFAYERGQSTLADAAHRRRAGDGGRDRRGHPHRRHQGAVHTATATPATSSAQPGASA